VPADDDVPGEETFAVEPTEWVSAVSDARDRGFTFFDWLTAVDRTYDTERPGFDVVVRLLDVSRIGQLRGIRISTRLAEGEPLPSLTLLFKGAAWHERETHEMFGIDVVGFDDGTGLGLRPLLLPDGFEGTPLRKSFVLAARASKPWPGAKEPGGGGTDGKPARAPRRRMQPPGVPDESWGPR
jgi:NADH-quinone oxidoreductase subunit C